MNASRRPQPIEPQAVLDLLLRSPSPAPLLSEVGTVTQVGDGIASVIGLERALADEVLEFACGLSGIVLDLEPGRLGVVVLGPSDQITIGEAVKRTRKVVSTRVGPGLLGRVVDPLGIPRDGLGAVKYAALYPVESEAPAIRDRHAITRPLATGIKAIDAAVPVGLGQRQLVIGDRQTGKTSLCVDAMLNQAQSDVICIYCAVGQRGDVVAKVIGALRAADMLGRVIVMAAGDEDATGLAYIAPYSAMAMAEYFSRQGRDVLIVFDDLTHHARSYRELSLLLRRPPGREAFPGDIFYIHARLLERAGQFADAVGGGSITALGVVETQAENLSAYIPTNLISITDGQIYLSPRLVRKNQFPAVDLGKSVSRVGGKAQTAAFRRVAGNLRVTLSQFEELEDFARFGTRLDDATRARLTRGAAVRGALRQAERNPMPAISQLVILTAAQAGVFDDLTEAALRATMDQINDVAPDALPEIAQKIAQGTELDDDAQAEMCALAQHACVAVKGGQDVPLA